MTRRQGDLFPDLSDGKKFVSDIPELLAQWHPTRNEGMSPDDISYGSGLKVWWICDQAHEWQATVSNRSLGKNCPYCSGNIPSPQNNLAANFPNLLIEWDQEKNTKQASEYTTKSNQCVWWKCKEGHSWKTTIAHRTHEGTGCPECHNLTRSEKSRPKTDDAYNLLTENPSLCEQWDYEKNKFPPTHYRPTSGEVVWWKCSVGDDHNWKARIGSRALAGDEIGNGCPFCAGKKPSKSYNLAVINPSVASEWHPTKNKKQPEDYTPSANTKVWWLCEKGHEWQSFINNRNNGRGCPTCSNKSSRNEIRILTELKALFPNVVSRHKVGPYEVDIFIPELATAIEYDGGWWHRNSYDKDYKKQSEVTQAGIRLLRVREIPLPSITEDDLFVDGALALSKEDMNKIIKLISPDMHDNYADQSDFMNEDVYRTYLDYFPNPFPENSLKEQRPEVAAEWHPTRNAPLTPANFTKGSSYKAWWQCEAGHEYQATIGNRCGNKRGCPFCSGRYATSETCLQTVRPDLAELFHPTKNGDLTPFNVTAGTGKKLWWICELGHEWQAAGYAMKNRSCPTCTKIKG